MMQPRTGQELIGRQVMMAYQRNPSDQLGDIALVRGGIGNHFQVADGYDLEFGDYHTHRKNGVQRERFIDISDVQDFQLLVAVFRPRRIGQQDWYAVNQLTNWLANYFDELNDQQRDYLHVLSVLLIEAEEAEGIADVIDRRRRLYRALHRDDETCDQLDTKTRSPRGTTLGLLTGVRNINRVDAILIGKVLDIQPRDLLG